MSVFSMAVAAGGALAGGCIDARTGRIPNAISRGTALAAFGFALAAGNGAAAAWGAAVLGGLLFALYAVTLGADTTLTGVNVQFLGTLNGAHALTVDDSGTTSFGGVVGGTTPLTSISTDAPGSVAVNTTAVTTVTATVDERQHGSQLSKTAP